MRLSNIVSMVVLVGLVLIPLVACGGGDDGNQSPSPMGQPTSEQIAEPTLAPTEMAISPLDFDDDIDDIQDDVNNFVSSPSPSTPIAPATIKATPQATETPEPTQQLPTLGIGSSMTYNETYGEEVQRITNTIIGEEIIDGIDCYVWELTFEEPWYREFREGVVPAMIIGITTWQNKTNSVIPKMKYHHRTSGGLDYAGLVTNTYGPDTYGPWYEGKSWTFDSITNYISPRETTLFDRACELEIVAVEAVTVHAGTFNCYKVNTTLVANYGVEVEPHELRNTTWWSAEEDVPIMVKDIDFVTYDRPVTRELVFFSNSADKKSEVVAQPTTDISSLPNTIPDPTYWPGEDWRTSTPEEQGMDSELLADMIEFIQEQDYGIESISIVRNGYLVTDFAIYPFALDPRWPITSDTQHILYSASKSITSALIGIAIDKGYIENIDQPVLDFFPDYTFANIDEAKRSMTIEHLLAMTTGLDWDESSRDASSTSKQMEWFSDNWVQFILDRPMVCAPGSQFNYNSGASYILRAIIQETTGMTAFEFAQEHLFKPLGITDVDWPSYEHGRTGFFLMMTPHDMAKIGYLYLHNGMWNNEQVVSSEWVRTSTAKHVALGSPRAGYGYQWWMNDVGFYFTWGLKGQYIIVVPEKNMVVVFTSGEHNAWLPLLLFYDFIIPAAKSNSPLPANAEGVELLESRIAELEKPETSE